eukprot:TRINITY_DN34718_c0_g1_i1.p1 TRINITY_DN34718_c0_g1~~TRINITY_DN34718_c0_g1_i1.p1  ORF type:complete len:174 (-),score=26.41 TRINITY_DN34718_c0_g1_i1:138-632(-)
MFCKILHDNMKLERCRAAHGFNRSRCYGQQSLPKAFSLAAVTLAVHLGGVAGANDGISSAASNNGLASRNISGPQSVAPLAPPSDANNWILYAVQPLLLLLVVVGTICFTRGEEESDSEQEHTLPHQIRHAEEMTEFDRRPSDLVPLVNLKGSGAPGGPRFAPL